MDNIAEIIVCPACGKEMKKIYMPSQKIHLDVCVDGCGGLFFDNQEFKRVDEQDEDITPLILMLENKTYEPVKESALQRVCPTCGMKMVKNFSSAKHTIQVDECYGCGGKFLDHSELEKIRAEYATEEDRAYDVIKKLYSQVGVELENFDEQYSNSMKNPSLLTRFVRWNPLKKFM